MHLVPHTHDDTGWQVTVDQYFFTEVYYVVDTVVDQLVKNPKRHFIYVETGFFARWWDEQPDDRRNVTKALVASGQLEFINVSARGWFCPLKLEPGAETPGIGRAPGACTTRPRPCTPR